MIKKCFLFHLKNSSFSRYLSFCLDFLVMYRNGLIKKTRLISNFMTSQPGYISSSKSNQIMKFGQLIECNMRNIFLLKSYTKCGGETNPRPFSQKLKLNISQYIEINIFRLSCRPLAFTSY